MSNAQSATAPVEVVTAHDYDGKPRQVGETYEADEQFIATLEALHYVRRAVVDDKPKRRGK